MPNRDFPLSPPPIQPPSNIFLSAGPPRTLKQQQDLKQSTGNTGGGVENTRVQQKELHVRVILCDNHRKEGLFATSRVSFVTIAADACLACVYTKSKRKMSNDPTIRRRSFPLQRKQPTALFVPQGGNRDATQHEAIYEAQQSHHRPANNLPLYGKPFDPIFALLFLSLLYSFPD